MVKRLILLAVIIVMSSVAYAAIECNVMSAASCSGYGTDVFHISDLTNAHAEFYDQNYYPNVVCCKENIVGLSLSVSKNSGDTAVVGLSEQTSNAHLEEPGLTDYYQVFLSGDASTVNCGIVNGVGDGYTVCSNAGYDTCAATMGTLDSFRTTPTNMHAGDCTTDPYDLKVCCDITYECQSCSDCGTTFMGFTFGCNVNSCSVCGGGDSCYFAQGSDSCNQCSGINLCSQYDNAGSCGIDTCGVGDCAWTGSSCVDLATDRDNCGSIGNVCQYQNNAVPGCIAGQCEIIGCQDGYGDCNQDKSDGCEQGGVGIDCCGDNIDNNCNLFILQSNRLDDDMDGEIDENDEGIDEGCDQDNDGFIDCGTPVNLLCSAVTTLPTCRTFTQQTSEFNQLFSQIKCILGYTEYC